MHTHKVVRKFIIDKDKNRLTFADLFSLSINRTSLCFGQKARPLRIFGYASGLAFCSRLALHDLLSVCHLVLEVFSQAFFFLFPNEL